MNNFLSLKLYKNNDLYLEKKSLNYAKTNNKYEFSLEDVLNTITEANFTAKLDVSEYTEEGEFSKSPTVNLVGVDNVNIDNVSEIKLTVSKDAPTNGDEVQEEVPQQ